MYDPLYYDGTYFYSNDREFMIRLALNNEKILLLKSSHRMTTHENSHTGNRKNIKKIRYEHIGIADKYLSQANLSL